jgi:hypothetical protein
MAGTGVDRKARVTARIIVTPAVVKGLSMKIPRLADKYPALNLLLSFFIKHNIFFQMLMIFSPTLIISCWPSASIQ